MSQAQQVFISHDKADKNFAHRLAKDLKGLGVKVWIAPESIDPGEDWIDAINRGLDESSHMVIVLTPSAIKSKWVNKETNAAIVLERDGQLKVIPLNVEPCKRPPLLTSYQMIPFQDQYEKGLSQLTATLGLGWVPEKPKPRLEPSPELRPEPSPKLQPLPLPPPPKTLERVRKIIAEQMGVAIADVQPETNLVYDLNADELNLVEIVMELEDEFDMSFPEEEAEKLHTVRDFAEYIWQHQQDGSSA